MKNTQTTVEHLYRMQTRTHSNKPGQRWQNYMSFQTLDSARGFLTTWFRTPSNPKARLVLETTRTVVTDSKQVLLSSKACKNLKSAPVYKVQRRNELGDRKWTGSARASMSYPEGFQTPKAAINFARGVMVSYPQNQYRVVRIHDGKVRTVANLFKR